MEMLCRNCGETVTWPLILRDYRKDGTYVPHIRCPYCKSTRVSPDMSQYPEHTE